jgi:hypothetical protein
MATTDAARDVRQCRQFTRGENCLEVRVAARLAECADFIVERVPVAREHMGARDDDVDFVRARGDRRGDFGDTLFEG